MLDPTNHGCSASRAKSLGFLDPSMHELHFGRASPEKTIVQRCLTLLGSSRYSCTGLGPFDAFSLHSQHDECVLYGFARAKHIQLQLFVRRLLEFYSSTKLCIFHSREWKAFRYNKFHPTIQLLLASEKLIYPLGELQHDS